MNAVVVTAGAGVADLKVHVINCSGMSVPSTMNQTPQGFQVTYIPSEPGNYSIHVTYGGFDVPGYIAFRYCFRFAELLKTNPTLM